MSLDINQTTWNHIPEDTNLHETCHCENLRNSHGKDPKQYKFHLHISMCAHTHTHTHTHSHTVTHTHRYIPVMSHAAVPSLFLDLFKILPLCLKYKYREGSRAKQEIALTVILYHFYNHKNKLLHIKKYLCHTRHKHTPTIHMELLSLAIVVQDFGVLLSEDVRGCDPLPLDDEKLQEI